MKKLTILALSACALLATAFADPPARRKITVTVDWAQENDESRIAKDFLKKTEPLPASFKVAANLPDCVTTPIVMRLLEGEERPESVTVMVQKEVAERLTAAPGTEEYGAITASLDLVADARITRIVGRQCFIPPPNVDSAVVLITLKDKGYTAEEIALARKIIRAAFNMRRKTLSNGLASLFGGKDGAKEVIEAAGFASTVRGETLSAADYVSLARAARRLGR